MNKEVGKWWGLYAVAFLVAGCATTSKEGQSIPHPRTGEPFSIEENDPEAPSSAAIWASRFGDDTLNGLIEEALESNIGLDAAKASAKAAEAAARISGSLKSPFTLGLNSPRSRAGSPFSIFRRSRQTPTACLSRPSGKSIYGAFKSFSLGGLAEFEAAEVMLRPLSYRFPVRSPGLGSTC